MKHSVFEKWSRFHMERAILILSSAFAACFLALAAIGCVSWYARCTRADTMASLIAADILRLREARLSGEGEQQAVCIALIQSRTSLCLNIRTSEKLSEILSSRDDKLDELCDALSGGTGRVVCTAEMLSEAIREVYPDRLPNISADSDRLPDVPEVPVSVRETDPSVLAEKYFGVKFVFRSAGRAAFCDNLYASFDRGGRIREFAAECLCEESAVRLTEEECLEIARQFALEQARMTGFSESVRFREGICWVEFTSADRPPLKLGIRGDTGGVCFCRFLPAVDPIVQN